MDIEIIFKIAAIGILTAVINQILKIAGKEEIATFVTLAGIIVVLFSVVNMISDLFTTVKSLFSIYQGFDKKKKKIIVLGIILSVLTVLLKNIKPEYSLICVIVGSIILVMYILSGVQSIFEYFKTIVDRTGVDNVMFSTLLKIIGVGYLIEFSASICNDSGNSSIADKIVLAGKILIFSMSLPIITNLFNMVLELI